MTESNIAGLLICSPVIATGLILVSPYAAICFTIAAIVFLAKYENNHIKKQKRAEAGMQDVLAKLKGIEQKKSHSIVGGPGVNVTQDKNTIRITLGVAKYGSTSEKY